MPKKARKPVKARKQTAKKTKNEVVERPLTVTLASILFALSAVLNLFVFVQVIFITEEAQLLLVGENAKLFGMIAGILGVLDLVAAYGLWQMRTYGGIVAVVDLVASVLIGFYPQPNFDAFSLILLGFNAALLILVVMNWKQLK